MDLKQKNFIVKSIKDLEIFLGSKEIQENIQQFKSILVQIFITIQNKSEINYIKAINKTIEDKIPEAIIVGMTALNEIANGKTIQNSNVISITFFESTKISAIALKHSPSEGKKTGNYLGEKIMNSYSNVSAVLLLANMLTMQNDEFIEAMSEKLGDDIHIFGGATATHKSNKEGVVFKNQDVFYEGAVAVIFSSEDLQIEKYAYIGWEPLSKEMTLTKVEDNYIVKEIDGENAFSICEKYLGIKKNEYNFMNTLEFPILLDRNGEKICRVVRNYFEDGRVMVGAEVKEGEKIRIAYGDPNIIIKNAKSVHDKMRKFNPEVIFIYSCDIRQIFMQEDVKLEIEPFQCIAPTAGIYTFGELCAKGKNISLLNMTLVAVGMKEGNNKKNIKYDENKECYEYDYKDKEETLSRMNLVLKLVDFIKAVVDDLEEAKKQLQVLLITDTLTNLNNRGKIEDILKYEMDKAKLEKTNLSVVLLDVDHFKLVNDTYGHHIGDVVLKEIANILKSNIRQNDSVGRWGGEEFMIVLKDTSLENATQIAERIRETISTYDFGQERKISASFGVIMVDKLEDEINVLNRVDKALYEAKNTGRNKVVALKYKG